MGNSAFTKSSIAVPVVIADGGTGADNAADARINLGLEIGVDVAAFSHTHTGVYEPANANIQAHISNTSNPHSVTKTQVGLGNVSNSAQLTIANNLSDLASASTARTNLGLGTIATQSASAIAITGGTISGITDLAVADGGTGASDAGTARTNLGLEIGVNVQAFNANLTTFAGIAPSANVQTLLGAANYAAFKTSLSLNNVENTALSTWSGSSSLTTLGTISSGTWNGSVIGAAYGGTGVANNAASTLTISGNFATTLTVSNTTTLTLPTTGTLATLAGSETLSGKTLTAPIIVSGGYIADANGNEQIIFTTTASAVNEVTIANAASTGSPTITFTGGDSNVSGQFKTKGTGGISFLPTTDNATFFRIRQGGGTALFTVDTSGKLITLGDATNLVFNATTGTKIGTATSQKLSFWNATPIVQPTTAIAASTFVANTSGIVNDTATFDGYTIGQIAKALRNAGLLA